MSAHYWRNHGQPGKNRFVSLAGSYHGETVGALAVTDVAIFRDAYAPGARRQLRAQPDAARPRRARPPPTWPAAPPPPSKPTSPNTPARRPP